MTLPKRSADPLQRLPTLPAVPQLLLLDRCKTSTKSRFHRNTPSLVAKTKCCVDRLRPPPDNDQSADIPDRQLCATSRHGPSVDSRATELDMRAAPRRSTGT